MTIATIADVIRWHSSATPSRPALTAGEVTWSFEELDRRSSRAAQGLAAAGVGAGDRVAFLDKNVPEYFEVAFGAAKLDATIVAINWRLAPREIEQIIEDANPAVLFVGCEFVSAIRGLLGRAGTPKTVIIGEAARSTSYDEWLAPHPFDDPGTPSSPDSVAFQFYTSGTTGLPKGVMLTNENVFALIEHASPLWGLGPDTVNLGIMPLFHVSGSGWSMAVMANGGHTVLHPEVDIAAILRDIPSFGVTHALLVPAVIKLLIQEPGAATADFSTLRTVLYGASPISDEVLVHALDLLGCEFVQAYGLTETFGAVTVLSGAEHDLSRPELMRSCGRAMPGIEIRAVDAETGQDRPEGTVGEVWVRGRQVMRGYWHNLEATDEAKTPDGWLRTGDAGYLRDGYLFLYDRLKDMIVSGGENVYPAEVENVLMGHPQVEDVAVIGVPDARWGETVKAVVVPTVEGPPTEAELIEFARGSLAHYKCPTSVDFVAVLPRNPSGKILKRELREPYWAGQERRIGG